MANPNQSIFVEPDSYIDGLFLGYSTTTTFTVSNGYCRDSEDLFNIILPIAVTVNTAVKGINGIDVGTFAQDTTYAVHVIADSTKNNPTGVIISTSTTSPSLPGGYDSFRRIGWIHGNTGGGSATIERFFRAGSGVNRFYGFVTPRSILSAGSATSWAKVLTVLAPPISGCLIQLNYVHTAATAGDAFQLGPVGAGDNINIATPSTTAGGGVFMMPTDYISGDASSAVFYQVDTGGSLSLKISGYYDTLG